MVCAVNLIPYPIYICGRDHLQNAMEPQEINSLARTNHDVKYLLLPNLFVIVGKLFPVDHNLCVNIVQAAANLAD